MDAREIECSLEPKGDELTVTTAKTDKHPVKQDGAWTETARCSYEDDEPVNVE
jgi:hypothetical protein